MERLSQLMTTFQASYGINFFVFLFFAALIVVGRTSWGKGKLAEMGSNFALRVFLDRKKYHLLHDLTLPTPNGTTQIDHVLVSPYGVFVIETKNMGGWIFGDAKQPTWTQTFYRKKFRFQNPLRQNYLHVKTIQEVLALADEQIHSLVVFLGDAKFKTPMPDNVIKGGVVPWVKRKQEVLLSDEQVKVCIRKLEKQRLTPGYKTNKAHIANLNARHGKRGRSRVATTPKPVPATHQREETAGTAPVAANEPVFTRTDLPNVAPQDELSGAKDVSGYVRKLCPKCSNPMVTRVDKRGALEGEHFWGCSAYPKCHTIEIMEKPAPGSAGAAAVEVSLQPCVKCEGFLVPRIGTRGAMKGQPFLGCSNYPKCRNIVLQSEGGEPRLALDGPLSA